MSEARPGNETGTQAHGLLGCNGIKSAATHSIKKQILPNGPMKDFETDITATAEVDPKD